jgi:hypothetical protein
MWTLVARDPLISYVRYPWNVVGRKKAAVRWLGYVYSSLVTNDPERFSAM